MFQLNYKLSFRIGFCCAAFIALWSVSAYAFFASAQIRNARLNRSVNTDNQKRLEAEKVVSEAEKLCSRGDADSCLLAIKKYQQSITLWKLLGESEQQASALRAIGQIYSRLGESQRALDYLVRSQKLCQASGSVPCEVATRNDLSPLYLFLGETEKAWEQCNGALKLSRDSRDRTGEAQALNNIGEVYYFRGDREKALEHYQQALPLWKELSDFKGQAQTLLYLGYSYADFSNTQDAAKSYQLALTFFKTANDIRGQALTLTALGHLHNNNGERQEALEYYDRATPLFRLTGDRLGEARALNGLGFIYNQLSERARAINYYQQARNLFREIGYKSGEASNLLLIGQVHYSMDDYEAALRDYQESLVTIRSIGDQSVESYLLALIGRIRASLGDMRGAFDDCQQALALNRKLKDRNRESYTLSNIAYLQERAGQTQQSLNTYNEALELSKLTGDRPGQSVMLYNIARVSRDLGNLDQARSRIEEALEISDTLRAKVSGQEMRALYVATVHQLYDFYVDVLMRLYKSRKDEHFVIKAFEANERGRARSLLEALAEGQANIREGVDAMLLQRERDLRRRMSELTAQRVQLAEDETSAKTVANLERQLDEVATEYQQVQGHIRASSPRYAALLQPVPLSLQKVQQNVIDAETVLLEYALGEERSFVWAVTQQSIKSFELPSRAEIERAARHVYELLTARNLSIKGETISQRQIRVRLADEEFKRSSAALAQMVLGPVGDELGEKRIVVVADGALQYLPFAALPSPLNSKETSTSASPLIVEHEIVLLPSASALWLMREELRGRPPASRTIAILADAVFDRDDERLTTAATANSRSRSKNASTSFEGTENRALRSFAGLTQGRGVSRRLPFSRREADAIKVLVPAKDALVALGFRANRATATSPELSQYRYIHFATHGLLNSEQPELSGILLSAYDEFGKRQNGFLQLHDVYNLKLSADLVVLSACETALGKDIRGEGLLGLTRGFMYAGVPRVVSSFWNVDDAATAELMETFYKAMLIEGKRPAEALRLTQIRMWKQNNRWSPPYYWAAFTLQGEWK